MDINDILDKCYNEVKTLTEDIRNYHCPNCGGQGLTGRECKYCHAENMELDDKLKEIEEILKNISKEMNINNISMEEIPVNKLCNILSTLSNYNGNYIELFLQKCNYKNKLYYYLSHELDNMSYSDGYSLTPLTKDAIETLVYMNPADVKMELIHALIIRRTLLHNPPISYECFTELIIHFVENLMHKEKQAATVKLVQDKDFEEMDIESKGKVLGTSIGCIVKINTLGIEELYRYGKEKVLDTIYHEVCHYYQERMLGKVHGHIQLLELKDYILSNYIEEYYKQNYWQISSECQARYTGKKRLIMFIKRYNMQFNDNSIFSEMKEEKEKMHMTNRTINDEEVDINEYFDKFIETKSEILSRFPILKELYEIKDGMVIPVDTKTVTR